MPTDKLEQIIQLPIYVPDHHCDRANILDLIFTFNSQKYSSTILPPFGSSDHSLISVSCTFAKLLPPTRRCLWYFDDTQCFKLSSGILASLQS